MTELKISIKLILMFFGNQTPKGVETFKVLTSKFNYYTVICLHVKYSSFYIFKLDKSCLPIIAIISTTPLLIL